MAACVFDRAEVRLQILAPFLPQLVARLGTDEVGDAQRGRQVAGHLHIIGANSREVAHRDA